MIYSVTVINLNNPSENLKIVLTDPDNSLGFAITDISGIGPGVATLNVTEWATIRGGNFNSSHFPTREITFSICFVDDFDRSIEDVRLQTYKWFPLESNVKLIFETDNGTFWIEGIVKTNQPKIFDKRETTSIDIVCPDPYFKNTTSDTKGFREIIPMFHFTFGIEKTKKIPIGVKITRSSIIIENKSTSPVGAIFTLTADGRVINPRVANETTNETLGLNCTMVENEKIIIDMRDGSKSIKNEFGDNKINYLDIILDSETGLTSTWFKLIPGTNIITAGADQGFDSLDVKLEITPIYEGI